MSFTLAAQEDYPPSRWKFCKYCGELMQTEGACAYGGPDSRRCELTNDPLSVGVAHTTPFETEQLTPEYLRNRFGSAEEIMLWIQNRITSAEGTPLTEPNSAYAGVWSEVMFYRAYYQVPTNEAKRLVRRRVTNLPTVMGSVHSRGYVVYNPWQYSRTDTHDPDVPAHPELLPPNPANRDYGLSNPINWPTAPPMPEELARQCADTMADLSEVIDEFRFVYLENSRNVDRLERTAVEAAQAMRRALRDVRHNLKEAKKASG